MEWSNANKLCSKSKLTVRKFFENTIYEVKDNDISKVANDDILKEMIIIIETENKMITKY